MSQRVNQGEPKRDPKSQNRCQMLQVPPVTPKDSQDCPKHTPRHPNITKVNPNFNTHLEKANHKPQARHSNACCLPQATYWC